MEQQVVFRRMETKDICGILEVEHACFTNPWTRQAFYNELNNNHFACYTVAELNDTVIGYGGLWVILNEAHVTNIAIHPRKQGNRIGFRLMRHMMKIAKILGADKMTLEVRKSNKIAQNMYHKLGFEKTGVRIGYYSDNYEDALIMWVNLYDTE